MKKLIAAAIILMLLPACHRVHTEQTVEITVITKALDSEWWQRVKAGAEQAAKASPGVRLNVLAPEREVNVDQQVSIVEDQITRKVSALAIAPTGAAELVPVLERARAAGIPVIIFDTDIQWQSKLTYVGGNNRRAGQIAGEYIVKLLEGKGKVAIIRGVLGVMTHDDRVAGFQDALRDAPGVKCVSVQPANSERSLGMSVMENLLTRYPDLGAVFATNDQMALGAVEAVAARNLTGKVAVVGIDATHEAVRAVASGRLAADVAMFPEKLGGAAVEAALKAARGEPLEKRIDIDSALVTKENAGEHLR